MPKHHKKEVGLKLVGKPNELINKLVAGRKEQAWALKQVTNEGPDHKQVHSALMLKRMYKLVQLIERSTGKHFEKQKGLEVSGWEDENTLPVVLPVASMNKLNSKKIIGILGNAPEHELVSFSAILQSIEWSISALSTK